VRVRREKTEKKTGDSRGNGYGGSAKENGQTFGVKGDGANENFRTGGGGGGGGGNQAGCKKKKKRVQKLAAKPNKKGRGEKNGIL